VRLSDSTLAIFSPPPFTPSVQSALSTHFPSTTVSYLIAPDAEHYLYIYAWHSAFPSARIVATESLVEKFHRGKASTEQSPISITFPLKLDQGVDNNVLELFLKEFQCAYFPSVAKEIVLLHKQSRTLLVADLIFNPPAQESYSLASENAESGMMTWLFSLIRGLEGSPLKNQRWLLGLIAGKGDDRRRFVESARDVAGWEIERLVPCHGEVVEGNRKAQKVWKDVFQDFLKVEQRTK
jgi:hypothetical protein